MPKDNILRKNAEECIQTYTSILVDGNGRGVIAPLYGSIYWEIEEKCFLDDICAEREQLSSDLESAFVCFLEAHSISFDKDILKDVIAYQAATLPRYTHDSEETVSLSYDWERYFSERLGVSGSFRGLPIKSSGGQTYQILFPDASYHSLKDFSRRTVLWGRKGGMYFNRLMKIDG